ncbi:MAG: glycerol kinase GlpK [Lachnospirales bacterium]
MEKYILAMDQGTSSSRAVVFNELGEVVSIAQKEIDNIYPHNGWGEVDSMEIWSSQVAVCVEALAKNSITPADVVSIGITNQRETTVVWNKETGKPIYNAILWNCRRTSEYCDMLKDKGYDSMIKSKTGLLIDSYFSATKIKWILDNVEGARELANDQKLLFGTVDTWLIWNLTKGKVHATDYSNASRTMLFNIYDLCWDKELIELFDIPESMLPEVKPSSFIFGETDPLIFGKSIPIGSCIGDQQASLFGQCCFDVGSVKSTYGTGCFILMNTGEKAIDSENGLLTSIAWGIDGKINYVLEGSVFVGGAAIRWLRDGLNIISDYSQCEALAREVDDTLGVYFVPAFNGVGTPYWNQNARGTIVGISSGVKKAHIVRATLESLAYQTNDVIAAMIMDSKMEIPYLKVDGGAAINDFLMQFQADIVGTNVARNKVIESTALGASFLAGLAVGYYKNIDVILSKVSIDKVFYANLDFVDREMLVDGWDRAVSTAINHSK